MKLAQLALRNFRNIERIELEPHPLFNIFYGLNAQGKTNLLESIYLLGSLKSFRSFRNEELIRHETVQAQIKGKTRQQNIQNEIRVDIKRDGKQARLNGKLVNRPETYLKCLQPVVFAPEEVSLIKGPPSGRRRLIDRAVFQMETAYLADIQKYERVLKQRNILLKNKGSSAELEPWTQELVRIGARIRSTRNLYIKRIIPQLLACYQTICGEKEKISIYYPEQGFEQKELENKQQEEFARQQEQERRYGMTLSGPHRDDFQFLINDRPLKNFGSQGQHRSFILAFKAAQTIELQKIYGEPPILLLDDLTGELDQQRQKLFYDFLLSMQTQVFITTTDVQPLLDGGIMDGFFYRVDNGRFFIDDTVKR